MMPNSFSSTWRKTFKSHVWVNAMESKNGSVHKQNRPKQLSVGRIVWIGAEGEPRMRQAHSLWQNQRSVFCGSVPVVIAHAV